MARPGSGSPVRERLSGSPAPALSKRDKRRTMLSDRLRDMVSSFGSNLRPHYEAQANAIQVDITLIMRAHPYENKPLEDDPEEISKLVYNVVGNKVPAEQVAEDDFVAGAGKLYTEFVHSVNDAMEERDVNLTSLANKYEETRHMLNQRHQFHVRLAHEEHRILSETLRQRLVQQISQRKTRLMKEKEQLDLGDSNAFLLHPSHFSITNPASPGGGHKRATRGTGRRGGDADDSGTVAPQDNRRKRKAIFDETDGQSPGPSMPRENTTASPWRDAKAKTLYHQYEAPVYSIDRLFTEKELAMNLNTAAIAAQNFLIKLKNQPNGLTNGNGAMVKLADADEGISGSNGVNEAEADADATPAAADMERGFSQTYHQTRGATKNALTDLAAAASSHFPLAVGIPTYIPPALGKAGVIAITVPLLTATEIESDLQLMQGSGGDERVYERTLLPSASVEYQYRALLPPGEDGFQSLMPGLGGITMSAQSSLGGISEGRGGTPLSGQVSAMGGVGMKRTASGTGSLLGVPENGRRVRSRMG